MVRPILVLALLLGGALAGCASPADTPASPTPATNEPATALCAPDARGGDLAPVGSVRATARANGATPYRDMGFDGAHWPRLDGVTLTILDHGAFGTFEAAKAVFEELTGATVVHVSEDDTGSALNRALREKGDPTFDVIYGIDNVLWTKAVDVFEPYEPLFSDRIDPAYVFFDGAWLATPVDHGYIGLNVDQKKLGANVTDLDSLLPHASSFVTQDPRTSTPGLGFLLVTIAACGEAHWKTYWERLFEGGVLVTPGWSEAYEQHFSAGYGADSGGKADKAIVTSYTESPAYEAYFGRPVDALATPVVAPGTTFHQIQTMGVAKGTKNLAAAQAWIEFSLTDAFQALAGENGVYPVAKDLDASAVYGDIDPEPGSFTPADIDEARIGANLEGWLREWTDLCERHDCA